MLLYVRSSIPTIHQLLRTVSLSTLRRWCTGLVCRMPNLRNDDALSAAKLTLIIVSLRPWIGPWSLLPRCMHAYVCTLQSHRLVRALHFNRLFLIKPSQFSNNGKDNVNNNKAWHFQRLPIATVPQLIPIFLPRDGGP